MRTGLTFDEYVDVKMRPSPPTDRTIPRSTVLHGASRLTAFIDVHQNLLFYVVCAWEEDFTGSVSGWLLGSLLAAAIG